MSSSKIKIPDRLEQKIEKGSYIYNLLDSIVPNLESIYYFPEYTLHNEDHLNKVLSLADELIPDDTLEKLNDKSIGILISAIAIHDLGMFIGESGLKELLFGKHMGESDKILSNKISWSALWSDFYKKSRRWNQKKLFDVFGCSIPVEAGLQEKFPENPTDQHRLLYGEFLRQNHERLAFDITYFGFPGSKNQNIFDNCNNDVCDRDIKDMIGIVARSHRMNLRNRDLEEYIRTHPFRADDNGVPIYYLMSILRIADSLHIGKDRAIQALRDKSIFKSPVSNREFDLNQAIPRGPIFSHEGKKKKHVIIDLSQDTNRSDTYIHFEEVLCKIQDELNMCWAVLAENYRYEYELSIHRIKSNILDEKVKTFREKFVTKKVELNVNSDIMHLLIRPLYGENPSIGVRELLQNAVDACNERDYLENKTGTSYESKIEVAVNTIDSPPTITITDNGIGMNEDTLLNYYLTVGASFRDSDFWKEKFIGENNTADIARGGRFGIGMLAGFLLGDEISVKTRHIDDSKGYCFSYDINVKNLHIERINLDEPGTTVTIILNNEAVEYFRNKDIYGKKYIDLLSKKLEWFQWYYSDEPRVNYTCDGEKFSFKDKNYIISLNNNINDGWNYFDSKEYPDVKIAWKIGQTARLFLNGFYVSRIKKFEPSETVNYGFQIPQPSLSFFDYNRLLNINIKRDKINNFAPEFGLIEDLYHGFLADALNIKGYIPRWKSRWRNNYITKSSKGFTICARPFLLNCKGSFVLFFTFLETIKNKAFHWPNVDFAIGFIPIIFLRYFVFTENFINRNEIDIHDVNLLSNLQSIEKNDKANISVNCQKYWMYHDDDPRLYNKFPHLYNGIMNLVKEGIFKKEEINKNVYLFTRKGVCNSSKRDLDIAKQISMDNPFATEYFPTETPKDKDNIMLQVLKKYIPYNINGGWIPFDMKERKDMYSKAFEELAKYMKKNIQ